MVKVTVTFFIYAHVWKDSFHIGVCIYVCMYVHVGLHRFLARWRWLRPTRSSLACNHNLLHDEYRVRAKLQSMGLKAPIKSQSAHEGVVARGVEWWLNVKHDMLTAVDSAALWGSCTDWHLTNLCSAHIRVYLQYMCSLFWQLCLTRGYLGEAATQIQTSCQSASTGNQDLHFLKEIPMLARQRMGLEFKISLGFGLYMAIHKLVCKYYNDVITVGYM